MTVIIVELGIGQYSLVALGKIMGKMLLLVHLTFLVHLIALQETLPKRYLVDTRLGNFLSIFMDLDLHCFMVFFQRSIGQIFANWFMECIQFSSMKLLLMIWQRHIILFLNFVMNLKFSTASGTQTDFILCSRVFML